MYKGPHFSISSPTFFNCSLVGLTPSYGSRSPEDWACAGFVPSQSLFSPLPGTRTLAPEWGNAKASGPMWALGLSLLKIKIWAVSDMLPGHASTFVFHGSFRFSLRCQVPFVPHRQSLPRASVTPTPLLSPTVGRSGLWKLLRVLSGEWWWSSHYQRWLWSMPTMAAADQSRLWAPRSNLPGCGQPRSRAALRHGAGLQCLLAWLGGVTGGLRKSGSL